MKRKKLVVWSGGLDSTLLLTDIADKFSTKRSPIFAYSFVVDFLSDNKKIMEKRARNAYLKWVTKKGYFIEHREVKISHTDYPSGKGWAQGLFWFSFIVPFIPSNCDVYFGYVQGDGIWLAVSSFHEAYQNLCYVGEKEDTELHYPFSYVKKWEVIQRIKEYDIPSKCFWTCEDPVRKNGKIRACGKCEPCRTLRVGEFDFYERMSVPRNRRRNGIF